jgi:ElaB/YqjD/DUF883 family membrane-anchored ribosome-binding protein
MATIKGRTTGGRVSLADTDREYLKESLSKARGKVGTDVDEAGVFEALERFGLSSDRVQRLKKAVDKLEVREQIDKASDYLSEQIENAREYTRQNPGKVIGGAAGVLVGASLLALAVRRAAGEETRRSAKTAAAPSASKKKTSKKGSSKKRR